MPVIDPKSFTYGAELEWADVDRRKPLPPGTWGWQIDHTVANSNGVTLVQYYPFGGEIQTKPTQSIGAQLQHFQELLDLFPEAKLNHSCALHVHIRAPGLKDNLKLLKQVQELVVRWSPKFLPLIDPTSKPTAKDYPNLDVLKGALKHHRWRCRSRWTTLSAKRIEVQLAAKTCREFFEREAPISSKNGRPYWFFQPRSAVNLRQLLATDTVEFRHFSGTTDVGEFKTALLWCRAFLDLAINKQGESPVDLFHKEFSEQQFPKFVPYNHVLEQRRQKTHPTGKRKEDVMRAIEQILKETMV